MPIHARARAFLESVAKRQILITYQELANALQILPPHSIHRVTEAPSRAVVDIEVDEEVASRLVTSVAGATGNGAAEAYTRAVADLTVRTGAIIRQ